MEPRPDDGDDETLTKGLTIFSKPQWSPVLTTGTTRSITAAWRALVTAAMEPRPDDGDDMGMAPLTNTPSLPQWSPVLTTGTTHSDAIT